MNVILHMVAVTVFALLLVAADARAGTADSYHDLVLGPSVGADQPFFTGGMFMLGNKQIKVEQGAVPKGQMVSYDPSAGKILVSDSKAFSDDDKGAAVLQLMDAMSIEAIEPAAGQ